MYYTILGYNILYLCYAILHYTILHYTILYDHIGEHEDAAEQLEIPPSDELLHRRLEFCHHGLLRKVSTIVYVYNYVYI